MNAVEPAGYQPSESYERKIPELYTGGSGDEFMAEMIKKYSVEGGKDKGKPNG